LLWLGRTKDNNEVSFWKCKYNTSKPYKGRWVCSGMECLSGRILLVLIPDCTADTLPQVHQNKDWTRDNHCHWLLVGQCAFAGWGYMHLTWYPCCLSLTNTLTLTQTYMKTCHNHQVECTYYLANYVFSACCRVLNLDTFTQFIHFVGTLYLAWHPAQAPTLATCHSMTVWQCLQLSFPIPVSMDPMPCTVCAMFPLLYCVVLLTWSWFLLG